MVRILRYAIPVLVLGPVLVWALAPLTLRKEKPELIYSHKFHNDMGIECASCHEKVEKSVSGKDDLLPPMDACMQCHDKNDCKKCHSQPDNPRDVERIAVFVPKFSHAAHIKKKVACETCHAGIAAADSSSVINMPGMTGPDKADETRIMASCMHCHDGFRAPKECSTCHEQPEGRRPNSHVLPIWRTQHGDDARQDDGRSCRMCHSLNYCQECHQGDNLLPRVHPLGYEFKHPLDVRSSRLECQACHEDRAFCLECHQARQVYPRSHQMPSWTNTVPGGGGRHAVEARLNIETCAGCHSDEPANEPVCAECHGQ